MRQISARKMGRLTLPVLLAASLLLVLTAAASASTQKMVWSAVGPVIYVGPSQDPSAPTSSQSEFKLKRNGDVRSVTIHTTNEQFAAVLAGGPGGGAFTECRARKGSEACEKLNALLTGSVLLSFHSSTARLKGITQSVIEVELVTPVGPVVLNVPVMSGSLRGKVNGQFSLSTDSGVAAGTADLKIKKGSTGTYACFGETPFGLAPLESLDPCIHDLGGQLFPIVLDVKDSGRFELGPGSGELADIVGAKGKIEVNAQSDLLNQQFGGSIVITKAVTTLAGDDKPVDRPGGDDGENEDEEEEKDGKDRRRGRGQED